MTASLAAMAFLALASTPWTAAEHTRVRLVTAAAPAECVPPCRSGYLCDRGACISACNPPCAPGEQCTSRGECVISGAPESFAPAPTTGGLTREQIYREIEHQRDMMPGTAGLKVMLGLNIPFFALAIIGLAVDLVFVGLGANLERSEGLLASLIICSIVGVGTGAVTVLGIVLLTLRAAEAAPYQRRIDELDRMLRDGRAQAPGARVRPGLTLASF